MVLGFISHSLKPLTEPKPSDLNVFHTKIKTTKMAAKWWRSGAGTTLRALSFSSSTLSKTSSYHTIQAISREVTGSKISAKERKLGRIPAVILNQNAIGVHKDLRDSDFRKSLVTTEKNEILKIMKSVELPFFCSTRFEIQIRPGPGSKVLLGSGKVLPIKERPLFSYLSLFD